MLTFISPFHFYIGKRFLLEGSGTNETVALSSWKNLLTYFGFLAIGFWIIIGAVHIQSLVTVVFSVFFSGFIQASSALNHHQILMI